MDQRPWRFVKRPVKNYRWQVRWRIMRWYKTLRKLEESIQEAERFQDQDVLNLALTELEHLQVQVSRVKVPVSYADNLYHLRLHIDFVRRIHESN